jgi:hypothetical protein
MDGRDWSSRLAPGIAKNREIIRSYGSSSFFDETRALDKEELKRELDELRALGYIK